MNVILTRPCRICALCTLLVLIQPVLASSGDTQAPGNQSSQWQAKNKMGSGNETIEMRQVAVDCLLAGDSDCVLEYLG